MLATRRLLTPCLCYDLAEECQAELHPLVHGEPLPALLHMTDSMIPTTVLSSLPVKEGMSFPVD